MTIEGAVEARNPTGIKLEGEWLNVSKFKPIELPEVGTQVRAEVDSKGFLKSVTPLGGQLAATRAPAPGDRLAILQAAAIFAAGREEIKSSDVLRIADSWLSWLDRDA